MPSRDELRGEPQPESLVLLDRLEATPATDQRATGIPRASISVAETAHALGVGRPVVYDLCNKGILPSFKLGARVLIPYEKFLAWIEQQADAGGGVAAGADADRDQRHA